MKFKKIYVEISDFCGLDCKFCTNKKSQRPLMDIHNFKDCIKKVRQYGKLVALHVLGDPLAIDVSRYLDVLLDNGLLAEITTSGFYMDTKNISILNHYKNIKQINFSLASFFWQNKISFEQYFTPIVDFCKNYTGDGFINLRLWNMKKNFQSPLENNIFYDALTKEFGVVIDDFSRKIRILRHVILVRDVSFVWPKIGNNAIANGSCYGLKEQIAILSNGVVVPCCMDTQGCINLGNIFKTNLENILQTKRSKNIIDGFSKNIANELLCQCCSFKNIKHGVKND